MVSKAADKSSKVTAVRNLTLVHTNNDIAMHVQ